MTKLVKLLALETSGRSGSVSLLVAGDDQIVCHTEELAVGSGSAKTLAPAIHRLLESQGVLASELTAIALLTGPGSFTGLRVGVATAKAMAYGLGLPVVAVDTLDTIAFQVIPALAANVIILHVVLDAYRGQVFYSSYTRPNSASEAFFHQDTPTKILDIQELLDRFSTIDEQIALCGPGCDRIRKFLADPENRTSRDALDLSSRILWIDGEQAEPQAESVARLGFLKLKAGDTLDAFHVNPQYFRGSAAEEVAAKAKRD